MCVFDLFDPFVLFCDLMRHLCFQPATWKTGPQFFTQIFYSIVVRWAIEPIERRGTAALAAPRLLFFCSEARVAEAQRRGPSPFPGRRQNKLARS